MLLANQIAGFFKKFSTIGSFSCTAGHPQSTQNKLLMELCIIGDLLIMKDEVEFLPKLIVLVL